MDYNTFPANPDLDTFIKCYWTLNIPKDIPKGRQQILPDGCMDMIFNLGDDVRRYLSNDQFLIQPKTFVLGQISKPFFIEPTGLVETFAVRFNPGCFSYFCNTSMSELADKDTALKELFDQKKVFDLESSIIETKDTSRRIEIVEKFLIEVLIETIDISDLLNSTIEKIFQTKGTIGVTEILESKLHKRRQLERKFSKHVGLSPKQLCRVIRLQTTLKAMLDGDNSLTDIGYNNEYFDQAHFIKDFKDFTGVSPKEFYKDESFALSSVFYAKE